MPDPTEPYFSFWQRRGRTRPTFDEAVALIVKVNRQGFKDYTDAELDAAWGSLEFYLLRERAQLLQSQRLACGCGDSKIIPRNGMGQCGFCRTWYKRGPTGWVATDEVVDYSPPVVAA